VRDGQKNQAIGALNTTWDDDGESLFEMTWPALVFGAAASWQPGQSSIDEFKNNYDWAFYRNEDGVFAEIVDQLDRPHALLATAKLESANDDLFWRDPFSEIGAREAAAALAITHDLRVSAEYALESLLRDRAKARLHAETLDDMVFAGWRLDALGMKFQYTAEINRFYWDAYLNQSDSGRVAADLDEITEINGRLEDLRGSTTRLRKMYEEAWLRENRPYWLGNVLVRYDNLAGNMQAKILAVREARVQYDTQQNAASTSAAGNVYVAAIA
jgi:hexosaminidase